MVKSVQSPNNLPLATIGVFLLWFGWFGFNGSVPNADPTSVSYVVTTTSIAAAIGGLVAGTISWVVGGKPDLTMALNGILAGLVGITAGPDTADHDLRHRYRLWYRRILLCPHP